MEGCRGNAGLVLELLGGDAGRRAADYGHPGRAEGVGERAGRGRLPRAREPDDADDAVGACGDRFEHLLAARGESDAVRRSSASAGHGRSAGAAAALDERERASLGGDQLGRGVAGRAGPAGFLADRLDALGAASRAASRRTRSAELPGRAPAPRP